MDNNIVQQKGTLMWDSRKGQEHWTTKLDKDIGQHETTTWKITREKNLGKQHGTKTCHNDIGQWHGTTPYDNIMGQKHGTTKWDNYIA